MQRFKRVNNIFLIPLFIANLIAFNTSAAELETKIITSEIVENPILSQNIDANKAHFQFSYNNRNIEFDLIENQMLIKSMSEGKGSKEVVFYKGKIKGKKATWARFMFQNGIVSGAYTNEGSLYFIKPLSVVEDVLNQEALSQLRLQGKSTESTTILFNADDVVHNASCGLDDHKTVLRFGYEEFVEDLRRSTLMATSREIRITLVADVEYVASSSDAILEMVQELNVISGIFEEQLNIEVVLEDAVSLSENGSLTSSDPEELLYAFKDTNIPNTGLRHLFTGKDLIGSTVGIAFVGSLCYDSSVGVTQKFGSITSLIFAHELGHNFGAPHDNQNGSACSNTPSGFIMNPSVGNATEFSACSIEQINPIIEQATTGFRACVTEIDGVSPIITSIGNTAAMLDQPYSYDSDNFVDVSGDGPFTFNLDIAPSAMTISSEGEINWIPTSEYLGANIVQISVENNRGTDTQLFDVVVNSDFINFSEATLASYGGNQDVQGTVDVSSDPLSINLEGNLWKSISLTYNVTTNTLLEFDFNSDIKGEIHAIGIDNNSTVNRRSIFNIHGTQQWLNMSYRSDGSGSKQSFLIPIGLFIQGEMDRLVFAMDNDNNTDGANSTFSNVRVFERESSSEEADYLDFSNMEFTAFRDNQDGEGTAQLIETGKGIELIGNRWRKVTLDSLIIGPSTVMEFEFKSESKGEIHGLGFVRNGDDNREPRIFQLYGSQRWGNIDFKYTGNGNYQKFVIPVGAFFTSDNVELIFIMDHDIVNPFGESSFKNIVFKN